MNTELKPCPFCGEPEAYVVFPDENELYFVRCGNIDCQAEGPVDLGESGAIERWNERASK